MGSFDRPSATEDDNVHVSNVKYEVLCQLGPSEPVGLRVSLGGRVGDRYHARSKEWTVYLRQLASPLFLFPYTTHIKLLSGKCPADYAI